MGLKYYLLCIEAANLSGEFPSSVQYLLFAISLVESSNENFQLSKALDCTICQIQVQIQIDKMQSVKLLLLQSCLKDCEIIKLELHKKAPVVIAPADVVAAPMVSTDDDSRGSIFSIRKIVERFFSCRAKVYTDC